ncbi:MAG: 2-phospho-L-lactate guanylyltransferase [Salinirussus sp.]
MDVLVPFDATEPKSRLSPLFDSAERRDLAEAMLEDVLSALMAAEAEPTVLTTAPVETSAPVEIDDRPLTPAINDRLGGDPTAVVVADLPLLTATAVERLLTSEGDVVLAPGLGGGTNALVVRTPAFRADYHGASIRDHRDHAREAGVEPVILDSFRLAVDIDEPADLAEALLHSSGRTRDWLLDAGVELTVSDGRVDVHRT